MKKKETRPNGFVQQIGPSWYLTYSVNALGPNGTIIRKRRKVRLDTTSRLSEADAREKADEFLADLKPDVDPSMTLAQFVDGVYRPAHIAFLKHSSNRHLSYLLAHHILPAWGLRPIASITEDEVQELITLKSTTPYKVGKVTKPGYSSKTCQLLRTAISGLFRFAIHKRAYFKQNPATWVRLPEAKRVHPKRALTVEQAGALIRALPSPAKEMVLIGITTSMGRSEILALRHGRVNLTESAIIADGESLPGCCLAIRENYYCGKFGTVKTAARERIVPLPQVVVTALRQMKDRAEWVEDHDLVFCSSERGVPVNSRNLERRAIKPVATKLGFGWFSWHSARRTFSSLTAQLSSWSVADRMFSMGHSSAMMTQHYAVADVNRRRIGVEDVAKLLTAPPLEGQASVLEGQVLEGHASEGPSEVLSALTGHQKDLSQGAMEEGQISPEHVTTGV
jgi:integrase